MGRVLEKRRVGSGTRVVGDSWLGRLRRAGVGALILLAVPLDMFELERRKTTFFFKFDCLTFDCSDDR